MARDTKQRMVEAAAASLRRRGLTATSFTDVLTASGAARGAIRPGGRRHRRGAARLHQFHPARRGPGGGRGGLRGGRGGDRLGAVAGGAELCGGTGPAILGGRPGGPAARGGSRARGRQRDSATAPRYAPRSQHGVEAALLLVGEQACSGVQADGSYVNLGIGLPALVFNYVADDVNSCRSPRPNTSVNATCGGTMLIDEPPVSPATPKTPGRFKMLRGCVGSAPSL